MKTSKLVKKSSSKFGLIVGIGLLLILALMLVSCGDADEPATEAPAAATEAPAAATEAPAAATEAPAAATEVPAAATEVPAAATEVPVAESMYHEAPMLADMVAAGTLPPVDERLPLEPLVEVPFESVGVYGGTLRRAFLGPGDHNNYTRVTYDALVRHAPDGSEVIPHIAKGWESNEDFTVWNLFLREGMKWSDGSVFNADAIM